MATQPVDGGISDENGQHSTEAGTAQIRTFVFLDLETTGLDQPIQITEISLLAVRRDQLLTGTTVPSAGGTLPRVMDKFTACVRPRRNIHPDAARITKLTNQSLGEHQVFNKDLVKAMAHFFSRQEHPLCLVAHNGERFDFPVLREELAASRTTGLFPKHVLCADTLHAISSLYTYQFERFSLFKIHEKLFGKGIPPEVAHTAEGDAATLIKIVKKLGAEKVLQWMDKHAAPFIMRKASSDPEGTGQFPCRHCGRPCKARIGLYSHMRVHHI